MLGCLQWCCCSGCNAQKHHLSATVPQLAVDIVVYWIFEFDCHVSSSLRFRQQRMFLDHLTKYAQNEDILSRAIPASVQVGPALVSVG